MSPTEQTTEHTLDADGRKLGRLASEVASKLMGKDRVDFTRRKTPDVTVTVENASQLAISDDKLASKAYTRHTGHPGGQRKEAAQQVVDKHGYGELIRRAVYGMLPDNKLRDQMMKNLKTEE
jgi:large subunit ribosomal protein L13